MGTHPPPVLTPLVRDVHYASASAMFFLIWDWLITFDDEVNHIWPKSHKSWLKWVFLTARYLFTAIQFCGLSLSDAVYRHIHLNERALHVWYIGQVFIAAIGILLLEIVLMTRVYALYNQAQWLKILFSSLLIGECFVVIGGTTTTALGTEFHPWLLVSRMPVSFTYLSATALLIQIIVVSLSIVKYIRSGLKTVRVVRLMVRDGSFVFGLLALFSMIMIVYTLLHLSFGVACYPWLLSALSCTICRTIINMQRVMNSEGGDLPTGVYLTSEFAFAEN